VDVKGKGELETWYLLGPISHDEQVAKGA
jgi:hypothetical protein